MLLACLLFVVLSVRANVVVRPEAKHFHSPGSGVAKCFFSTPLTECLVRISEHNSKYFDSLRNMSSGSLSPRVAMHKDFHSSYAGNGVDPGRECGIKVDVGDADGVMLVECFGRTMEGEWGRGFGTITSDTWDVLPVNFVSPWLVLATPGTNVAVLLKADRELTDCDIRTPSAGFVDMSPGKTPPTDSRYVQHGAVLNNRDCGVELTNVQESDSGVWHTKAYDYSSSPYQVFRRATVVLVTVTPVGFPVLKTNDTQSSKAGDMVQATCHTPAAVPAPNITWLLGGHVVRHDELNATLPGDVGKSRPWQRQPRHQTFTHRLTTEDNGKRLECRMEHVALATPITIGHELAFVVPSTATTATTKTTETEVTTPIAPVASCGVKRPMAPSLTESCGLALAGDVGGSNEAVLGQFPWHAAIFGKNRTGLELLCAATLISRRHLLTAAHCVCDINSERAFEADSLLVALGSTTRTIANDSTAQLMAVESVHINRWFRGAYPYFGDLAVLRLRELVNESDTVQRACVDWRNTMEQEDLREGRTVQLATWGAANQSSLRWLNLTYSPESACVEKLEEDNLQFRYFPDTLCAEFFEEREHCAEDAGAGLVFKNATTQRHYVRGVAGLPFSQHRYESGCDFKNWLTGFTRLSAHLDWLEALVLAD